jgi:signal transduction histidine kinase
MGHTLMERLGLPGVVLAAAFGCDLLIILSASLDSAGPRGVDLLLLPGIAALSACALWARKRPVAAAFAGCAVLVASSVFIRVFDIPTYTTLLVNVSFAEAVAGTELVFFCVRAAPWGVASAATSSLVVSGMLAVAGRSGGLYNGARPVVESSLIGLLLLVVAIVAAVRQRKPIGEVGLSRDSSLGELLRGHWPLIGAISAVLFLDIFQATGSSVRAAPVVLCSIAAAGLAVYATRRPVPAAGALAGVMLLSSAFALGGTATASIGGTPITQAVAGCVVVVCLIRQTTTQRATVAITLLAAVVALAAVLESSGYGRLIDLDALVEPAQYAALALGLSIAIGLYLRSRDTARNQQVRSAVTEAQTAERMALARELHDVVAHHVTGIVVQAQAARMVAERNPQAALDSLGRIENAGTEALTAMRRLVRSMRGDAPVGSTEFSEQATTDLDADLHRLVEGASHGVPTELELDLPEDLPQEMARSALRLVQEALTNVGKHAQNATLATVSVGTADGDLHLRVRDNGSGERRAPDPGGTGYGLVGMRERVELLHGRLTAGPAPDGGWLVEAWLPLHRDGRGDEERS